jgi:hypothetical protein
MIDSDNPNEPGQGDQQCTGTGSDRQVDELSSGMTGVWLVLARTSRHRWDLDRRTYTRLPGPTATTMPLDGVAVRFTRVVSWPQVGQQSLVLCDDRDHPGLEHWRLSSTITQITREGPAAGESLERAPETPHPPCAEPGR